MHSPEGRSAATTGPVSTGTSARHGRDSLFEVAEGVATITLNRPDVLNSFTRPMAALMLEALGQAAEDQAIRAVLLTGAGRGFCAGQDLAEAAPKDGVIPDLGDFVRDSYNPIVRAIRTLEKPVVCAVNGVAAGAGANLAFACDIVFASSSATFIQSFAKIGVIPDSGGTFILPRIVGLHRAIGHDDARRKDDGRAGARLGARLHGRRHAGAWSRRRWARPVFWRRNRRAGSD